MAHFVAHLIKSLPSTTQAADFDCNLLHIQHDTDFSRAADSASANRNSLHGPLVQKYQGASSFNSASPDDQAMREACSADEKPYPRSAVSSSTTQGGELRRGSRQTGPVNGQRLRGCAGPPRPP